MTNETANPTATYDESRFDGKRRYELYPNVLIVSGIQVFRSEFRTKLPLQALHPDPSTARVRNALFPFGCLALVTGAFGALVQISTETFAYESLLSLALVGLFVAGLLVGLATFRKVPYVIFLNESGQPMVGIISTGTGEFEEFIRALEHAIVESKSGSSGAA